MSWLLSGYALSDACDTDMFGHGDSSYMSLIENYRRSAESKNEILRKAHLWRILREKREGGKEST